jgi:hypothetical protein
MLAFCRLGRGTKPNIIDGALPNLPKNVLSVQALNKGVWRKVAAMAAKDLVKRFNIKEDGIKNSILILRWRIIDALGF